MANIKEEAARAAEALKSGKTLLYPTDTVWGLGCDATNAAAIERIFEIKNRPTNKSLIVLVDSIGMLKEYVRDIPEAALRAINEATRPTTIIYEESIGLAHNISGEPTPHTFKEISQQIKDSVDYVAGIRQDEEKPAESSAIIKIKGEKIEIIR